jgi:hypothetical protein
MLAELLPQVADTFHITMTECMGPGVRRDDDGVFIGACAKFPNSKFQTAKRLYSRAAARVELLVDLPFLRGDGAPNDAPW